MSIAEAVRLRDLEQRVDALIELVKTLAKENTQMRMELQELRSQRQTLRPQRRESVSG